VQKSINGYRFGDYVAGMVKRPRFLGQITKRGFTLVELLVVISIIAMLLAILMPSLQRARSNALSVVCKSNIAQLAMAAASYSRDNREYYTPVWMDKPNNAPPGGYWFQTYWYWQQIMGKYLGDQYKLALCPAGIKGGSPVKGNYGLNLNVVGNTSVEYPAVKQINIRQPSRVILACDSGTFYAAKVLAVSPTYIGSEYLPGSDTGKKKIPWPDVFTSNDAKKGRHPDKRICIGFVDCHSSWLKVSVLTTDDYWLPGPRR